MLYEIHSCVAFLLHFFAYFHFHRHFCKLFLKPYMLLMKECLICHGSEGFFTPFFRFLLQSIIINCLHSDIFGFWFYFFRRRLHCINSSVIQGCHKNLISFQFFKYGFHGNYRHRNMITFTYLIILLLMSAFLLKTLK